MSFSGNIINTRTSTRSVILLLWYSSSTHSSCTICVLVSIFHHLYFSHVQEGKFADQKFVWKWKEARKEGWFGLVWGDSDPSPKPQASCSWLQDGLTVYCHFNCSLPLYLSLTLCLLLQSISPLARWDLLIKSCFKVIMKYLLRANL